MNKKLERRENMIAYGCDYVNENIGVNERLGCNELIVDLAALQSELESLRPKGRAFDWIERNANPISFSIDDNGIYSVWFYGNEEICGKGKSLQFAIEDFIAKHEVEIPDKGDTMETIPPSEIRNVLEIRDVAKNIVALFFDGERCSGDHRSESAFGKTYTKLADYIASLESRLAELEELAEAVDAIKSNKDIRMSVNLAYQWSVWNCNDAYSTTGHGDSIPAAFADYREKHPELKEDEATELLKESLLAIEKEIELFGHGQTIRIRDMRKKLRAYLAREKGNSHED